MLVRADVKGCMGLVSAWGTSDHNTTEIKKKKRKQNCLTAFFLFFSHPWSMYYTAFSPLPDTFIQSGLKLLSDRGHSVTINRV